MEELGYRWTDFYEIWYLVIFRKSVMKIQLSLTSNKKTGTLIEYLYTYMTIFHWILLRMRNVWDESCRLNQNTHYIFNKFFFFRKSCRLWDNVEKYGVARDATDDNIIQHMRFECWITKTTYTFRICNTYCFWRRQWFCERVSVLRCTYIGWFLLLLLEYGLRKAL